MAIVGGLDLHRKQITFDVVDTTSGTIEHGRVMPADRESFRRWLSHFDFSRSIWPWRLHRLAIYRRGVSSGRRPGASGRACRRRRPEGQAAARQDRPARREASARAWRPTSCRSAGSHPSMCWRFGSTRTCSRSGGGWLQRIHATLFHLGAPAQPQLVRDPDRLARLEGLSPVTRQTTAVALHMIETLDGELTRLPAELVAFGATDCCTSPRASPADEAASGFASRTAGPVPRGLAVVGRLSLLPLPGT